MLGLVALLHSERFHNYLLKTAQQKASEALGSQVQMQGFAFHLSGLSPTVDLYGVIVDGAAPYADPPLLQAEALHFGVTVTSLLHKSWYVGDVRIEHPVVRLFADRNGHTNLPTPNGQGEQSSHAGSSVFDLGIRHLLLERGEIYYNNRKSELSADLHDLTLQSSFELLRKSYSGTLSYRDGHLQLQNASPIAHNFDAQVSRLTRGVQAGERRSENCELTPLAGCDYPQLLAASGACNLRCNALTAANFGARLIILHCRMESSCRRVPSITMPGRTRPLWLP